MDLAIDKFDPNRFGLITGSACTPLFPKKSADKGQDSYARKLAYEMYFKFYDAVSTWQMQHGSMNEHEAFEFYQSNFAFDIEKGEWKNIECWGGTCDALHKDYGLDFKCPTSLGAFLKYLFDGIDEQQYNQAQMYMFIFNKPMWKVCAYLTETQWMLDRDLYYPVEQDKRMIVIEVEKNPEWESTLRINSPNVIRLRDMYLQQLINQFGR